jgi:3-hydroxyacyl-[acyl-carrier-protein] dehydratase
VEDHKSLGIEQILKLIPHRHPFLLIDRIVDYELGTRVTGLKAVTYNEWYFEGLPPVLRIVPALILSEAIAQLGAVLIRMEEGNRDKLIYFSGLDKVRFRKPVRPGDILVMTLQLLRRKGRLGRFHVEAKVESKIALEGIMQFALE